MSIVCVMWKMCVRLWMEVVVYKGMSETEADAKEHGRAQGSCGREPVLLDEIVTRGMHYESKTVRYSAQEVEQGADARCGSVEKCWGVLSLTEKMLFVEVVLLIV